MSGPPLVVYFGSHLSKGEFRSTVTRLLMAQAAIRFTVYAATGLIRINVLLALAASLPAMFLGTILGHRVFTLLPEKWFRILLGAVLLVAGLMLFG